MALSDYLTSEEWNACFYLSLGKHQADNFGASMHITIDYFLKKGYKFPGLTDTGDKKEQVEDGVNAPKVLIFLGNPEHLDVFAIIQSGRKFVKNLCPELLNETEEEWVEISAKAKKI